MDRYTPRPIDALPPMARLLAADGIALTGNIYSPETIRRINAAVDPVLAAQRTKARAYVTVDGMARVGLLDTILGGAMRDCLLSVMPDPVLYHCHIYEIAADSATSHIFAERLAGWHRDPDCAFVPNDPTHVSVFVFLSDVGADDGTFQFLPVDPRTWVRSSTPAITVGGPAGLSFLWNRAFYHRASPNRGPRRRRLLKVSVHRNAFPNRHIRNRNFQAVLRDLPEGNPYLDLLFGRHQGHVAPQLSPSRSSSAERLTPTGTLGVSDVQLALTQARELVNCAQGWLLRRLGRRPAEAAAYD